MPEYRLYFLDRNNRIDRRLDLECRDDEHAIDVVGEHQAHAAMELWCGPRFVKRFEPAAG